MPNLCANCGSKISSNVEWVGLFEFDSVVTLWFDIWFYNISYDRLWPIMSKKRNTAPQLLGYLGTHLKMSTMYKLDYSSFTVPHIIIRLSYRWTDYKKCTSAFSTHGWTDEMTDFSVWIFIQVVYLPISLCVVDRLHPRSIIQQSKPIS